MKFVMIGAGGIGGYYGGLLSRAGHEVRLLARGANLDAIRSNGLIIRTPTESWTSKVEASDDANQLAHDFGEGDFAIIATKAYSLNEIAPAAKVFADVGAGSNAAKDDIIAKLQPEIESKMGHGTTVYLRVPLHEDVE